MAISPAARLLTFGEEAERLIVAPIVPFDGLRRRLAMRGAGIKGIWA